MPPTSPLAVEPLPPLSEDDMYLRCLSLMLLAKQWSLPQPQPLILTESHHQNLCSLDPLLHSHYPMLVMS